MKSSVQEVSMRQNISCQKGIPPRKASSHGAVIQVEQDYRREHHVTVASRGENRAPVQLHSSPGAEYALSGGRTASKPGTCTLVLVLEFNVWIGNGVSKC